MLEAPVNWNCLVSRRSPKQAQEQPIKSKEAYADVATNMEANTYISFRSVSTQVAAKIGIVDVERLCGAVREIRGDHRVSVEHLLYTACGR